jgi:hypothetical protein
MSYSKNREIPSLTFHAKYKPGHRITDINCSKTRVRPPWHSFDDREYLEKSPDYRVAQRFAYFFAKYRSRSHIPQANVHREEFMPRDIDPSYVVHQFSLFASEIAGRWADRMQLPVIYRTRTPENLQRTIYRTRPGIELASNSNSECKISNPIREVKSWISHSVISYYLNHGEPPCTREELSLLTSWLNRPRDLDEQVEFADSLQEINTDASIV